MSKSSKGLWTKLFVVVTFVAMVTVNALANILPINRIGTGAVSDSYPNLFAPAGLTFAIWGLIYLLLAGYTLYQLGLFRGKAKEDDNGLLRKTGIVFSVSSLVNIAWIFSWHYKNIPFSTVLIAFMLICLIDIMHIIDAQKLSFREKLFVRLPFSVYFGWITVATIANVTTLLVSVGWDGFGLSPSLWTVIVLVVGMVIGAAATIRYKSMAYGLVLIWAYAGILIKHTSASGFANQYMAVIITVAVCMAFFIASVLYVLITRRRQAEIQ
jgi:hypothetical protein